MVGRRGQQACPPRAGSIERQLDIPPPPPLPRDGVERAWPGGTRGRGGTSSPPQQISRQRIPLPRGEGGQRPGEGPRGRWQRQGRIAVESGGAIPSEIESPRSEPVGLVRPSQIEGHEYSIGAPQQISLQRMPLPRGEGGQRPGEGPRGRRQRQGKTAVESGGAFPSKSESPRSEPVGLVLPAQAEGLGYRPQIAPAL
jgi:hypothetical protein